LNGRTWREENILNGSTLRQPFHNFLLLAFCIPQAVETIFSQAPLGTLPPLRENNLGVASIPKPLDGPPNPHAASTLQRLILNPHDPVLYPQEDGEDSQDNPWDGMAAPTGQPHEAGIDQFFHQDTTGIVANPFEDSEILHNPLDKHIINLMKILNDMNAPDYAFEQVLRWAVTARREGFQFTADRGYSRKSNLRWMFQMTANSELQLPSVLPVEQESGSTAEVVTYRLYMSRYTLLLISTIALPCTSPLMEDLGKPCRVLFTERCTKPTLQTQHVNCWPP